LSSHFTSSTFAAIVGGGIGGTATAHFLRQKFEDATISIFEPGPHIGGRLKTVTLAGKEYECGGTVIHPANQLIRDLVKEMGLKERNPGPESTFTLVAKEGVVFQQTSWSFLQPFQLIWRYGLMSVLKLNYYITAMLDNFGRVYPYLERGNYVESVTDLLKIMAPQSRKEPDEMAMLDLTTISLEDELLRQSLPQQLIDELVMAAVRTNYGQSPFGVHAFVGSVALAGAQGGLWAIEGGNHILAEKMLVSSKAALIQSEVKTVILNKTDGRYAIHYGKEAEDTYDIVILVTPMTTDTQAGLKIEGLQSAPQFPGKYHQTVANMVHGIIDPSYIGLTQAELTNTNFIIDPSKKVNSFALQIPVNYVDGMGIPDVWKVFSQAPLTDEEMDQIFLSRQEVKTFDWLAYPHYATNQSDTLGSFRLHDNLYHINSIEWAASAMEMSVMGAKNVVNMIFENSKTQDDNQSQGVTPSDYDGEL
jgi:prenylcysteine oxidase/farnesylcysteine lyase